MDARDSIDARDGADGKALDAEGARARPESGGCAGPEGEARADGKTVVVPGKKRRARKKKPRTPKATKKRKTRKRAKAAKKPAKRGRAVGGEDRGHGVAPQQADVAPGEIAAGGPSLETVEAAPATAPARSETEADESRGPDAPLPAPAADCAEPAPAIPTAEEEVEADARPASDATPADGMTVEAPSSAAADRPAVGSDEASEITHGPAEGAGAHDGEPVDLAPVELAPVELTPVELTPEEALSLLRELTRDPPPAEDPGLALATPRARVVSAAEARALAAGPGGDLPIARRVNRICFFESALVDPELRVVEITARRLTRMIFQGDFDAELTKIAGTPEQFIDEWDAVPSGANVVVVANLTHASEFLDVVARERAGVAFAYWVVYETLRGEVTIATSEFLRAQRSRDLARAVGYGHSSVVPAARRGGDIVLGRVEWGFFGPAVRCA